MVIDMNDSGIGTLEQLRRFLDGTLEVRFTPATDAASRYGQIARVVRRFGYAHLPRADKQVVLRYLGATSGFGPAQVKRLVARACAGEPLVRRYHAPPQAYARRYTEVDVRLLAAVDTAFGTLSGPATVHVLRRALDRYDDRRFERLARLSVSHLYNLRASRTYERQRVIRTATRPSTNPIGTRRAPAPAGRAGFIRIDSVHQGDLDGAKGVYYVNAVDCVTQWQAVACCERISEAYLLPVLEQLLASFPFAIRGFHADNGSEYINHKVATLLDKLRVEFTKSRPRHSNDNGLAETKNGAVIRKQLGYEHIPQCFASAVNAFCAEHLNPYLNFHRPCLFAEELTDKKGKIRKRYPQRLVMTPFEKLAALEQVESHLRPGITLDTLRRQAASMSDNDAAARLNEARSKLFLSIHKRSRNTP
jgi:transposase InsO family protein